MSDLDDVLFDYVSRANPKSNEDLNRFLRRYPEHREKIIDFTATWRAMAILDAVLPPAVLDPAEEQQMLCFARAHLRTLQHRRAKRVTAIRGRTGQPSKREEARSGYRNPVQAQRHRS